MVHICVEDVFLCPHLGKLLYWKKNIFRNFTCRNITPGSILMSLMINSFFSQNEWEMLLISQTVFQVRYFGARLLLKIFSNVSAVWFSHFVQDESVLEPELYERAEKLFRVLLRYVTDFLVWEENFELSAELQPRYWPVWSHANT